jgi:spore maturation protein CgeB
VVWQISHPDAVPDEQLEGHDLVLVASPTAAVRLGHRISTRVATLLQFADEQRFSPVAAENRQALAFVGNWRGELRPAVWGAVRAGWHPALYGEGWQHLFPALARAEHVPHEQLAALYSGVDVLLNDHWDDMRREGFVSNRLFDALACGTFVLSDQVLGLPELFSGGVATYRDEQHLAHQLERFAHDPRARRVIASRGRKQVLARHTASHRAAELLELLATLSLPRRL